MEERERETSVHIWTDAHAVLSRSGHVETAFTSHANYKGTSFRLHIVLILILKRDQKQSNLCRGKKIFGDGIFDLFVCFTFSFLFVFGSIKWQICFFFFFKKGQKRSPFSSTPLPQDHSPLPTGYSLPSPLPFISLHESRPHWTWSEDGICHGKFGHLDRTIMMVAEGSLLGWRAGDGERGWGGDGKSGGWGRSWVNVNDIP